MLDCPEHATGPDDSGSIESSVGSRFPRRILILRLSGDVDLSLVGRLRTALDRALSENDEIRVDLSGLRTIDSAAIRELLRAQALAARDHRSFGVTAANANAHRILERADARGLLLDC